MISSTTQEYKQGVHQSIHKHCTWHMIIIPDSYDFVTNRLNSKIVSPDGSSIFYYSYKMLQDILQGLVPCQLDA